MSREIRLTKEQVSIVDDDDFEYLSQWKWFAKWNASSRGFYACRSERRNGKSGTVWMHRQIMQAEWPTRVDHVNRQGLDNRRSNLRLATAAQNNQNARLREDSTSGIRGVNWRKDSRKWRARIAVEGKKITIGLFDKIEDAKAAYAEAARKYHGEFACIQEKVV